MKRIALWIVASLIICPMAYGQLGGGHGIFGGGGSSGGGSSATQASLHIDDILTALGIASEATTMPNGTDSVWPDGSTQAAINQALETAVEGKAAPTGTVAENDIAAFNDATGKVLKKATSITVSEINMVRNTGFISGLMPQIVLTNATGAHDGDANAATLADSGESFTTSQFVGMTIYNITDGSSCTVTANDATTVTCTLAGGTDNDWDVDDVWQVGPGPGQSGSWFYVTAASTLRWPSTVGYAACMESAASAALTIDMPASMVFTGVLNAAVESTSAAEYIVSSGSTSGDYMCIVNKSTTSAQGKGKRGTWSQES